MPSKLILGLILSAVAWSLVWLRYSIALAIAIRRAQETMPPDQHGAIPVLSFFKLALLRSPYLWLMWLLIWGGIYLWTRQTVSKPLFKP